MPPAPLGLSGYLTSRLPMLAAVLGILPACARGPEVWPIRSTSVVIEANTEFTLPIQTHEAYVKEQTLASELTYGEPPSGVNLVAVGKGKLALKKT